MQGRNVFLAGLFGVGRGDCVNLVAQPVLHATECFKDEFHTSKVMLLVG